MDQEKILDTAKRYRKYTLWMVCALALAGLLAIRVMQLSGVVTALVVAAAYSLAANIIYGRCWQRTALRKADKLGTFYLVASVARLFSALLIILIGVVVLKQTHTARPAILSYVVVFVVFYLAALIFDSFYFARIERKTNIK